MTTQNLKVLREAAKAVLRGKFIAIQSYLKKQEKHQVDSLTLHLKQLEKEQQQQQQQISWKKEIIKIQAEINEKEMKETISSVHFSSVAQSCLTLCNPMNSSMPGLPVHHQLPESTQNHVHWVSNAIQPSHPLLSPSPPTPNLSQHQGLFKWVSSLHQRWPKYWNLSFNISPSNEHPGLISFRMDWLDLQGRSLQPKGFSRIFSNTTVQKPHFFGTQLSSQSNAHIHIWLLENHSLD